MPALTFATEHLAPRAPTDPAFLHDLEQTMALLIFPANVARPPALARLLEPWLRTEVAARVNCAVLQAEGARARSRLCDLIRTRFWAERMCRDEKRDLPPRIALGLDGATERENGAAAAGAGEDSVMQGNGEMEAVGT